MRETALIPASRTSSPYRWRQSRGLTMLEIVLALVVVAVAVWLLLPKADPTLEHGRRLRCMAKLRELHKGAAAYAAANGDCLPLAWHVAGSAIADDLANLSYSRFDILEHCDPSFSHVVTPRDVDRSIGLLPARQQKYRHTADFWKCPTKGWTDDYFAPEVAFSRTAVPTRQAQLAQGIPAADRPLFADVNASLPNPHAEHLEEPGHNHELRNGFSTVVESEMPVFVGVGPSLRVEGDPKSSRLDFRHGGAANVIFLDGHADFLMSDDALRLQRLYGAWNHLEANAKEK